ncbi:hypothetical protein ACUODF_56025, partial [Escherichia coli]
MQAHSEETVIVGDNL